MRLLPTRPRRGAQAFLATLGLCLLGAFPVCAQDSADKPDVQAVADASSDQANQTASIAGTVLAAATGQPLNDARIMLVPLDPGRALPTRRPDAISDEAGHFAIANITPGRYMVHIERDGYIPRHYGSENPRLVPAVLILSAGQSLTDLIFKMLRPGVISGRVTDKDGEPLAPVAVEAYERGVYRGNTVFTMVAADGTDDRGEYRIFGLSPGKYWVVASYRDEFGRSGDKIDLQSYPPVYYPKASSMGRATPLHLGGGDQISDINFTILANPVRGYEISGKVLSASSGELVPALVLLEPVGNPGELGQRSAEPGSVNGSFKFSNVPPGKYWLTAKDNDQSTASQQITVADSDVHDVPLVFRPGIEIAGHVTVEGKPSSIGPMLVNLLPRDTGNPSAESMVLAQVQADGTFTLKGVADGSYDVTVSSECDQCYLKSAISGKGVDLLAGGVEVSSGIAPVGIEMVYSANTAEVDGTVTDEGGKPEEGALVIFIASADARNRNYRGRWGSSDQYGRFDVRGLAPGSYSVIALQGVDDEDDIDFTAPDFLKPFASKARAINVVAGDHKSLRLEQVPLGGTEQ